MDIDGLGEKLAAQLIDASLVRSPADLFDLEAEDLIPLERMGRKKAQNLVDAIQAARDVPLPRLIYALGIPHVGRALADTLATEFGSLEALGEADEARLSAVADIGPTVAEAICGWFANEANRALIADLKGQGVQPKPTRSRDHRLAGKTLVITGTLDRMTRDEAKRAVRRQGGRASSSVSGQTDYLLVGASPGHKKMEQARRHDVGRLDEQRFLELVGPE